MIITTKCRTIIKSVTAQHSKKMKNVAVRRQRVNVRRQTVQRPVMMNSVRIQRWCYPRGKQGPRIPKSQRMIRKSNGSSVIIPTWPISIDHSPEDSLADPSSPKPYHHHWIAIRWDELLKSIAIDASIHQLGQPCVHESATGSNIHQLGQPCVRESATYPGQVA